MNGFTPGGKELVLAARLEGPLKTAFPDGAPTNEDREEPVDTALAGAHVASTDNANLVLVADVPEDRELSYPGVANVVGNALRELNLEDVEPAAEAPAEGATVVEYRTFDGLVVRVTGTKTDDESWITLEASGEAEAAEEAAAINEKVGGWRYKIASFQYDQMTRRMADLLKAPPAA